LLGINGETDTIGEPSGRISDEAMTKELPSRLESLISLLFILRLGKLFFSFSQKRAYQLDISLRVN
jgi:hypothetical protein